MDLPVSYMSHKAVSILDHCLWQDTQTTTPGFENMQNSSLHSPPFSLGMVCRVHSGIERIMGIYVIDKAHARYFLVVKDVCKTSGKE